MKTCVIVDCFDNYNIRTKHVEKILIRKGYNCYHITSNYNHIKKRKKEKIRIKEKQLKVLSYKKNMSIMRLMSHYFFSKRTLKEIKKIKPDLIYAIIPPNNLVKNISKYKSKNNVRLIYDVFDLWPESFPQKTENQFINFVFMIWRNHRDNYIKKSDLVVTECQLYEEKLKEILCEKNIETLYLTKEKVDTKLVKSSISEYIEICYLGSINHILDLDLTINLVQEIIRFKPVIFNIIGDGEKREELIKKLRDVGSVVNYHGKVFDDNLKLEIMGKCHFGINLMKDSVTVGLTMKSIDYINAGLPLINNIVADTFDIVDKYDIGINISNDSLKETVKKIVIINDLEMDEYKKKCFYVFDIFFSPESFEKKFNKIIVKSSIDEPFKVGQINL